MVSSATPVVGEQHGLGLMQAQTTLDFLCGAFQSMSKYRPTGSHLRQLSLRSPHGKQPLTATAPFPILLRLAPHRRCRRVFPLSDSTVCLSTIWLSRRRGWPPISETREKSLQHEGVAKGDDQRAETVARGRSLTNAPNSRGLLHLCQVEQTLYLLARLLADATRRRPAAARGWRRSRNDAELLGGGSDACALQLDRGLEFSRAAEVGELQNVVEPRRNRGIGADFPDVRRDARAQRERHFGGTEKSDQPVEREIRIAGLRDRRHIGQDRRSNAVGHRK